MRTWKEIETDAIDMANMRCKPSGRSLPPNTILDEEKSVKWNREEVKRKNEAYVQESVRLQSEKNKLHDALRKEIAEHISYDLGGKVSNDKAIAIWDYAYADSHSYGIRMVFTTMYALEELVQGLLEG